MARFNHPIGGGGAPKAKPMANEVGGKEAGAHSPGLMAEDQAPEQDGDAIAQEHGPAHEVHVMHDHEGGMHHVHSMHPSGHEHDSDHASAGEAHDHAKKLAGGEAMEPEGHETEHDEEEPWGK